MPKINQVVEGVLKDFDEKFKDSFEGGDMNGWEEAEPIRDFLKSSIKKVLEAVGEEVDIIQAEEPSNFPSPEGQDAVYHVCGRIKEKITNITKEI